MQKLNRRLLDRLRPMALEHLPLSAVLTDMIDRWRRHQPEINWSLTLPADPASTIDRIDDSAAVTLYRVLQESLMNAARHAGAATVDAGIAWEAESNRTATVRFRITDDGTGLPECPTPGVGIQSMTDRVQALGGTLRLLSTPDSGVTVTGEFPVTIRDARHDA
jgi:two-component system sensor histidine kinase UhpB